MRTFESGASDSETQLPNPSHTRVFASGAIRDDDDNKPDYEAYLSPLVIQRFGEYMLQHSTLPDGTKRSGDNWQRGFGLDVTLKSLWRHHVDVWSLHRSEQQHTIEMEEALCAVLFNAAAYLHQLLSDDPIDAEIAKDAAFYRRMQAERQSFGVCGQTAPFPSMPIGTADVTSGPSPSGQLESPGDRDYAAWEASQPDVYMDRCAGEHQRAFEQALEDAADRELDLEGRLRIVEQILGAAGYGKWFA